MTADRFTEGKTGRRTEKQKQKFYTGLISEQFLPLDGIFNNNLLNRMDRACSWLSNSYLVFKIHEHGEKIHAFSETPVSTAAAEEQRRNNQNEG